MGPAPFLRHQYVAGNIYTELNLHLRSHPDGQVFIAPTDIVLRAERPATILQPDVCFVSKANAERLTSANIQGPPDLVVEVLSPGNARKDAVRKLGLYQRYGVPEYWIVPEACDRIEVLRLDPTGHYGKPLLFVPGEQLTTPLLPGFELTVAKVFPAG
jgi:Uma2 family endonuclease